MNIIQIPVSRFSKKIILTQNNFTQPIKISATDTLAGILCAYKPGDGNKIEKIQQRLTETIEVVANDNLSKHLNTKRKFRAGLLLNDIHRDELNRYIQSKVEEKISATSAIYRFCENNNIEIDLDENFEALFKDWQRFSKKNILKGDDFIVRKNKAICGQNAPVKLANFQLFSDDDLDASIHKYAQDNRALFISVRGNERKKLHRQLTLYVYRKIGMRTPLQLIKKFGSKKLSNKESLLSSQAIATQHRNIRRNILSFNLFLLTAPSVVTIKAEKKYTQL